MLGLLDASWTYSMAVARVTRSRRFGYFENLGDGGRGGGSKAGCPVLAEENGSLVGRWLKQHRLRSFHGKSVMRYVPFTSSASGIVIGNKHKRMTELIPSRCHLRTLGLLRMLIFTHLQLDMVIAGVAHASSARSMLNITLSLRS
jgi:hypothetical protein